MSKGEDKRVKIIIPTQLYENLGDQTENIIRKGLLTLKIQFLVQEVRSLEERIAYLRKRITELPNDIKREERMLNELIEDRKKLETILNRKSVNSFG
ncbi:MAG: hypothetical protein QXG76_05710 [Candidatus Bathyarchaeia archaeon]